MRWILIIALFALGCESINREQVANCISLCESNGGVERIDTYQPTAGLVCTRGNGAGFTREALK